jgi:two-component system, sensor histidine kinase PdtaS
MRHHVATAHNRIGIGYNLQGERSKALPHFLRALEITEALGKQEQAANVRSNIARLHLDEGRLDMAEAEYRRSMEVFRDLGNAAWEAGMMQGLADVYRNMGERDSALVLFGRAADILSEIDQPLHAAIARHDQALYTDGPGEDSLALARHREAVALMGDGGNATTRITLLGGLGKALTRHGKYGEAEPILREVLRLAQEAGQLQSQHDMHRILSHAMEQRGEPDKALFHMRQYVSLHDSLVSIERARSMVEAQERYESDRKDVALAHNRALLERRARSIRLLVAGSALLILSLVLLWRALRTKRRLATALQHALDERGMLLREIHHRVKNNLQMVGGLLRMQGRHIADPTARDAIRDSQDRVRSMALIHQDLYFEEDPRGIDMAAYVEKLAHGLQKGHGVAPGRIALHLDVDPLRLDVDTAMPIGLILNELIVNALKHAFPMDREGNLHVVLRRMGEELLLEVTDDGVGHGSRDNRDDKVPGFGLGMLRTFADKLDARYEMNGQRGTSVRMHIRNFQLAG